MIENTVKKVIRYTKFVIIVLGICYVALTFGLGCRFEANCLLVGPGPIGGVPSVGGGLSKES